MYDPRQESRILVWAKCQIFLEALFICNNMKENLKHILDCREFKKVVKMDLKLAVEEVMSGEGSGQQSLAGRLSRN